MRVSSCEIGLADLAQAFGGIAKTILGGAGRGRQSARRCAVSSGGQRPGDGDGERRPNANRREMIHLRDGVREAAEQFPAMRSGMRLRRSRNEKRADRQKVSQLMTHGSSLPVHPRRRIARVSHRRCHRPATCTAPTMPRISVRGRWLIVSSRIRRGTDAPRKPSKRSDSGAI